MTESSVFDDEMPGLPVHLELAELEDCEFEPVLELDVDVLSKRIADLQARVKLLERNSLFRDEEGKLRVGQECHYGERQVGIR